MEKKNKKLANPFSTGGGGVTFEIEVQAAFTTLMITGGHAPCLPPWPITKIRLQGRHAGYHTDDLIVYIEEPSSHQSRKLLCQIKHKLSITERNNEFSNVIHSAWKDFNNERLFTRRKDCIALITGPLSAVDIESARKLLEFARSSENADDYFRKINRAYFIDDRTRDKLKVFQLHLKSANNNRDVSLEDTFQFLRHFHLLGYDLDLYAGVTLSLLHSHISLHQIKDPHGVWAKVREFVGKANLNAGVVTLGTIPEEVTELFKQPKAVSVPEEFGRDQPESIHIDWENSEYADNLALANIIGIWNEKEDKQIVGLLTGNEYSSWIGNVRKAFNLPNSPLTFSNGTWRLKKESRQDLWQALGPRLFDDHLDRFQEVATTVLSERDPMFDLGSDKRYAARIHGKYSIHSYELRRGLAESLALLGSFPDALTHCSIDKREHIASLILKDIFANADWKLWATLNRILPLLAEAAPDQFLGSVENALMSLECPFDELFAQEGDGMFGDNYMSGLLWALETLAWDEIYIVRATLCLGKLAQRDPGGTYGNRPSSSLTDIYLPWLNQTTASFEKQKVAIGTLVKEVPEISWNLLLTILPNKKRFSNYTHKPGWRRTIQEEWSEKVTGEEYFQRVSYYADQTVALAKRESSRLCELIENFSHLPKGAFEQVLAHLESAEVADMSSDQKKNLWSKLLDYSATQKKYNHDRWVQESELSSRVERIIDTLKPENPFDQYRRLFVARDHDLYEDIGQWNEQAELLENKRKEVVKKLLDDQDLEAVIQFAKSVESPEKVGYALAYVVYDSADAVILPSMLDTEIDVNNKFASGYVWGRYCRIGWKWVDKIDKSKWSGGQTAEFLAFLPFTKETWQRSKELLRNDEGKYWRKTGTDPFREKGSLDYAINKLIEYGRPSMAIYCIASCLHDKKPFSNVLAIKALMAAISSDEDSSTIDAYYIGEVIKALQEDICTNQDDLFKVEWAYLPLLERDTVATPETLENRLATSPDFFCELIRLIYKSKNKSGGDILPTEQQKKIAENAYRLLHTWTTPPGLAKDNTFSGNELEKWLSSVLESCKESGHVEVAMIHAGQVLLHCPPDPSGLWIHRGAAQILNLEENNEMRSGFQTALFNQRGAHWVDPTGKPEKELSKKYNIKAEELENAGYFRFASTLRKIADSYEREAKRVIEENNDEE